VHRSNLHYEVHKKPASAAGALQAVAKIIQEEFAPGDSGIVYCLAKKETEAVAEGLQKLGIRALHYHAGMEPWQRLQHHRRWGDGEVQVIVATVAFGMGINKVDVRFVVHHTMAKSMETYYQESGRAGRDGKAARCILMWRPADLLRQFANAEGQGGDVAERNLRTMGNYASGLGTCRHLLIASHFGEAPPEGSHSCDVCAGQVPQTEERDITGHAKAVIATIAASKDVDEDLTLLKLVDKWRASSDKQHKELAQSLLKEECEALIVELVLQGRLGVYIRFTAYNCNSYIRAGRTSLETRVLMEFPSKKVTKASRTKKPKVRGNDKDRIADSGSPKGKNCQVKPARLPNCDIGQLSSNDSSEEDAQQTAARLYPEGCGESSGEDFEPPQAKRRKG